MTHTNLLFETFAVAAVLGVEFGDASRLPSAHIADRWGCLYSQEVFGTQVTVVPDARRVARGTSADPEVISQIAAGVGEGNAKLSRVEQIKRFRVLPTFWEPGGDEITLTMKLKRKPINEKYAAEIEELYASELGQAVYEPR